MNIGERLKIARNAIGYTLKKASNESGIGESSISEFENNNREPRFSQLNRLSEIYKRSINFFLTDEPLIEEVMLWRDNPAEESSKKEAEVTFRQLCEQYHELEVLMAEKKSVVSALPKPNNIEPNQFDYRDACRLAEKTQKEFGLGDIPSTALKQILEERYHVKIFYLEFSGSAISTVSPVFGPAVLLNKKSKPWRRNYDLAHELFHLLTWELFRRSEAKSQNPDDSEEKLANAFASRLLLPTDSVKESIDSATDKKGNIDYESLDEIAREFGVSLEALLWRMVYLFNKKPDDIIKYIETAKSLGIRRPSRLSDEPDVLPERYCSLAIKALNEGKLSLMKFRKYLGITYKEARQYLKEEDETTDEKIAVCAP